MSRQSDAYALEIVGKLKSLIDPESEEYSYNLETVDLTDFFIGLIKGAAYFYNALTGDDKNFLECTHLFNQLIVQDMLEGQSERVTS